MKSLKATLKLGFKQQPICTPLAPTRNKIIYKTACSDGPNSGSGKSFSKPASLKRASLVALPVAISHKASLKPKRSASATLIQKTSKNEPKHGPKNGTAWRSHFWDRMHSKVKEQKKSTFTAVPFLGPSGGTKNETAKSQNQQQRPTRATNKKWQLRLVSNKHIELEQRRPAHTKPDFNWLSGPRNGTWKRTCGISCLRSLAPMRRLQCSTTQATFTNPSLLRATPLLRGMF